MDSFHYSFAFGYSLYDRYGLLGLVRIPCSHRLGSAGHGKENTAARDAYSGSNLISTVAYILWCVVHTKAV